MPNGGSGLYPYQFGGGPTQYTDFSLIHDALNQSRGTAYNVEPGTIVWCENYALASGITGCWTLMEHLKAELIPSTSTDFLSRWETIFGVVANQNATAQQRQQVLAGKMSQWSSPPTFNNIKLNLQRLLGPIFVDLEFFNVSDGYAAMPADTYTQNPHTLNNYTFIDPLYNNPSGGVNLSSQHGVVLPSGQFYSNMFWLKVRVWQPRDQFGNLLMDTIDFLNYVNNYQYFMLGYLPSYCFMTTLHYKYQPIRVAGIQYGGIEAVSGTQHITGVGTFFDGYNSGQYIYPSFEPGDPIEVVDSNNELQTYTVETVNSPTSITTVETIENNINYVLANFRTAGFICDVQNLDGICSTGH